MGWIWMSIFGTGVFPPRFVGSEDVLCVSPLTAGTIEKIGLRCLRKFPSFGSVPGSPVMQTRSLSRPSIVFILTVSFCLFLDNAR